MTQRYNNRELDCVLKFNKDGNYWGIVPKRQHKVRMVSLEEGAKIYNNRHKYKEESISPPRHLTNDQMMIEYQVNNTDVEHEDLPNGIYRIGDLPTYETVLFPLLIDPDQYIELHDNVVNLLQKEITEFVDAKETYKQLALRYRKSFLLYGDPGNGKTAFLTNFLHSMKNDAVVLFMDEVDLTFLNHIKDILDGRMVIFVLEELTECFNDSGTSYVLNFLDGAASWSNCLIFATTNYPEKLQRNIVDRPSRFDRLLEFKSPNSASRRKYLIHFLSNYDRDMIDKLVIGTEGYSTAYLRELVLQVRIHNAGPTEILETFEKRKKLIKKAFAEADSRMGF